MANVRLDQVREGSKVRVKTVAPDRAMRGRLCALGITPGAEVEIFSQNGQCCIRIRNTCIALCRELACCIECETSDFSLADLAATEKSVNASICPVYNIIPESDGRI